MSNLLEHARTEMQAAGLYGEDTMYGEMLPEAVEQIVKVFDGQGHSGMSASIVVSLLEKLLRFEPLVPLTGEDDEWQEVGNGMWQNRRCNHVFKDAPDGRAYDIEGRVFVEPDGSAYTSNDSRVFVEFPYTPHREYVKVEAHHD